MTALLSWQRLIFYQRDDFNNYLGQIFSDEISKPEIAPVQAEI
ncbi:MAG: hypothetical protein AB7U63_19235 [Porticoccaceae bacterium]|jgi:hypothetical protein